MLLQKMKNYYYFISLYFTYGKERKSERENFLPLPSSSPSAPNPIHPPNMGAESFVQYSVSSLVVLLRCSLVSIKSSRHKKLTSDLLRIYTLYYVLKIFDLQNIMLASKFSNLEGSIDKKKLNF